MAYTLTDYLKTGEFWRLVIDGPKQAVGPLGFTEKNYTTALIQAARFALTLLNKKIDYNDLQALHQIALQNVRGTNYGKTTDSGIDNSQRDLGCVSFVLNSANSSLAGFQGLLYDVAKKEHGYGILVLTSAAELSKTLSASNKALGKITAKQWRFPLKAEWCYLCHDNLKGLSPSQLNVLAQFTIQALRKKTLRLELFTTNEKHYEVDLQEALDRYHKTIHSTKKATGKSKRLIKLTAIAKLCREGARIHPFLDGNGRIFCMLLPYLLCMQQGFSVPLMRDVNLIGNHAITEIVKEIEVGIERTEQLMLGHLPLGFAAHYRCNHDDLYRYYSALGDMLLTIPEGLVADDKKPQIHQRFLFQQLYCQIYSKQDKQAIALLTSTSRKSYLSITDPFGNTALHLALKWESPKIATAILAMLPSCADLMQRDKLGDTALDWAIHHNYIAIAKSITAMLEPCDLQEINPRTGDSPLKLTIRLGHIEIQKAIAKKAWHRDEPNVYRQQAGSKPVKASPAVMPTTTANRLFQVTTSTTPTQSFEEYKEEKIDRSTLS